MAGSAASAGFAGRYDAILTFDYENLSTTIGDNARLLGERLAAVGVSPGDGRRLDIVAHSMGGLVSRWFIEMDRGNQVVRKLVMLGTRNAGSPWPRLVDWATVAMALGLNGLTGSPWPARVLRGLTAALGDPRVSLREMNPGSETLAKLSMSPDPGVPYTILTGDTSTIQAEAEPDGAVSRLLGRLLGTNPIYAIANPFFHKAPNDLAVSITSMTEVPGHPPTAVAVACDHITYFSSNASLAELSKAL
jgi:pimeloyl-ACP methyl ester carboxylesterase